MDPTNISKRSLPGSLDFPIKMIGTREKVISRALEKGVIRGKFTKEQQEVIQKNFFQIKASFQSHPEKALAIIAHSSIFSMAEVDENKFYSILIASFKDSIKEKDIPEVEQLIKKHVKAQESAKVLLDALRAKGVNSEEKIETLLSKLNVYQRGDVVNALLDVSQLTRSPKILQKALTLEVEKMVITPDQKDAIVEGLASLEKNEAVKRAVTHTMTKILGRALGKPNLADPFSLASIFNHDILFDTFIT